MESKKKHLMTWIGIITKWSGNNKLQFNKNGDYIKENETMSIDEVNKFCEGLARYKRPRKIIFANVPRNSTGKIEKPKLRAIYSK